MPNIYFRQLALALSVAKINAKLTTLFLVSVFFCYQIPAQTSPLTYTFGTDTKFPTTTPTLILPIAVDSDGDFFTSSTNADNALIIKNTPANGSYTTTLIQGPFLFNNVNVVAQGPITLDGNGYIWWTNYAYVPPTGGQLILGCCAGEVTAVNPNDTSESYVLPVPSVYALAENPRIDWQPGPIAVNAAGNYVFVVNNYDGTLWLFIKTCQLSDPSVCGWGDYSKIDTISGFGAGIAVDSNDNVYVPTTNPTPEIIEEVGEVVSGTLTFTRKIIPVTGLGASALNQVQWSAGGIFVSDYLNSVVYELTLGSSGTYTQRTVGTCQSPAGIAYKSPDVYCLSTTFDGSTATSTVVAIPLFQR